MTYDNGFYQKKNTGHEGFDGYPYYSHNFNYASSSTDNRKALKPLIRQIQEYDSLRLVLEERGGGPAYLNRITEVLTKPFCIKGYFRSHRVALTDHAGIYAMLNDVGDFDLHFSIRRLDTGMPVYYLCRTRQDYWAEYSLIVQDLYKSPGYPMPDDRFVKLMRSGHEVYYLRLSHFRRAVVNMLAESNGDNLQDSTDEFLYNLGRHVFQAAWHEDQQLGVQVAKHFSLSNLRFSIELLYLCLSAELCALRGAIDETMLYFFDMVYPQPAIRGFLSTLAYLDGEELNEIPKRALGLYMRLSKAFSCFLGIKVTWGNRKTKIPLYKLIYGNFSRLELVSKGLKDDEEIREGAMVLESEAQAIIEEIMKFR